ncbi:MAG: hypothetical protein AAF916_10225 [Planctomycetota bacterium]
MTGLIRKSASTSRQALAIEDRAYAVYRSLEPIFDADGDERPHVLNLSTAEMVLGPKTSGHAARSSLLAMYFNAVEYETGKPMPDYAEMAQAGGSVDMMLDHFGLDREVLDRIDLVLEQIDQKPTGCVPRGLVGVAACVAVLFGIGVTAFLLGPRSATPSLIAVDAADAAAGDLTADLELHGLAWDTKATSLAAHPNAAAFVVANTQRQIAIYRPPHDNQVIAETSAPTLWLHIAPDGTEAAVADWSGTVTVLPLAPDRNTAQHQLHERVSRVYALGRGEALCVFADGQQSVILGGSRSLPAAAVNAMPSTSDARLLAYEASSDGQRWLTVTRDESETLLTRQLEPGQQLRAFDANEDQSRIALILSDGKLCVYQRQADTMKIRDERDLGYQNGTLIPFIKLCADGRTAWIGQRGLVRWNLDELRTESSAEFPYDGKILPNGFQVQQSRLLMGGEALGAIWQ